MPSKALIRFLLAVLLCPASALAQSAADAVIGELHSPDATVRGSVMINGADTHILTGSQITAGASTAKVDLKRGGGMSVCKRSNITVTSASNGREMLIALNSGALEAHYELQSTTDTILTPDFRIALTGPGAFHFAVGVTASGGMCVKSLTGNTSSIIVNEQFGDGAHQVKPGEQAAFHNGRVDDASADAGPCGCPELPMSGPLGFPEQQSRRAEEAVAAGQPAPVSPGLPVPPSESAKPGQTFTQIDAPMVYRAEEPPPPIPSTRRDRLPPLPYVAVVQGEPPAAKHSWFQRLGSAISGLFSGNSKRKTSTE